MSRFWDMGFMCTPLTNKRITPVSSGAFERERRRNIFRPRAELEIGLAAQLKDDSGAVDDVSMVEPGTRVWLAVKSDGLNILIRRCAAVRYDLKLLAFA